MTGDSVTSEYSYIVGFFSCNYIKLKLRRKLIFFTLNNVRTRTEPSEHEHCVHVHVRLWLEPNLEVQVQVRP